MPIRSEDNTWGFQGWGVPEERGPGPRSGPGVPGGYPSALETSLYIRGYIEYHCLVTANKIHIAYNLFIFVFIFVFEINGIK